MSIFKACDIRGRYGTELTLEHAHGLGRAIAQIAGRSTVLVGGDGRLSTPALKQALVDSLLGSGCDVIDLGCVSTPMFYFARQKLCLDRGVMVTASHNPAEDNGFKITLGPLPVTEAEMASIARIMTSAEADPRPGVRGTYQRIDVLEDYLAFAGQTALDLSGLKVVIDCANGMNGPLARPVWERTGAEVLYLLEGVDGRFPAHSPNPAQARHMKLLQEQVCRWGADLGIAYDGDGDRVGFVDELGQPVTGDQAIVLFAQAALRDGPESIVFDQKCSRIVPELIRRQGGTPVMERSGHTYIKRAFLQSGAAYAGELSGHHFLRPFGDDALIASLAFAWLVKASGKPLSHLTTDLPHYAITPDIRVPMPADLVQQVIAQLEAAFGDEAVLSHLDGLRIEYPDAWGLVRASVTEPVITLRFEGTDEAALRWMIQRVEAAVPDLGGKIGAG